MNIVSCNSAYKNLQYANIQYTKYTNIYNYIQIMYKYNYKYKYTIYKSLSAAAYNSFSNTTVVEKLSISAIACLIKNKDQK